MAVTVCIRTTPTTSTFTQGGQKETSVPYNVDGLDYRAVEAALSTGVGIPGIPKILDPHPYLPGLLVRGYRIRQEETGLNTDVEVVYQTSNMSGGGLLYAVPDISGNQFVWEMTFEDVEVVVPVAFKTIHTVSTGAASKEVRYWEVTSQRVTESRSIIQARWQIGGGTFDTSMRLRFEAEHNKLHVINGVRYLFRVGGITPRDNLTYEVRASWTRDKGTPIPSKPSSDLSLMRMPHEMTYWNPSLNAPANIWPNDASLMRSPYHHLETVPGLDPGSDDDDLSCPFAVQFRDYELGDKTNLPNVPI